MSDEPDFRAALRQCLAHYGEADARSWAQAGHLPAAVLTELGRHGVYRQRWEHGAHGGAARVVAMAQETAAVSSGLALAAMAQSEVFCGALTWLAEAPVQRDLLAAALDGTALGCLSSTEPTGGSDVAGLRTTVRRDRDGWHLRGRKRYISNLGGATHTLVLSRLADRLDPRDLSLFIVPLAATGVQVTGYFPALGLSACDVGEVELDLWLPGDALLGAPGMGLAYLSRLLQFERLSICAQLAAGADTALGLAVAFAQRRVIAGDRLIDKQAIRHRLARCRTRLWLLESALRDLVGRTAAGLAVGRQTAALKLEASRIAESVTDECLQVFGARGYTSHYPLEQIWRDVRLARIGGGSEEIMTELVASGLDRPDPQWNARLDLLEQRDVPVPAG